jgi:hypothetical protein
VESSLSEGQELTGSCWILFGKKLNGEGFVIRKSIKQGYDAVTSVCYKKIGPMIIY